MPTTAAAPTRAPLARPRSEGAPGSPLTYGLGRSQVEVDALDGGRRLQVVPPVGRRRLATATRRRLVLAGVGATLAIGLIANVGLHAMGAAAQFRLQRLDATAQAREAEYQRLRLDVARLEAPKRVVDEATRLGLVQPPKVTYLSPSDRTQAPGLAAEPTDGPDVGGGGGWQQVKPHLDEQR